MGFASLGCVLFLSPWNFPAWNILKGNGTRLGTITEKNTMKVAQQGTITDRTIPPIDAAAPAITETATFAMGWFWGPDARFGLIPGVIRTRVGYAGGTQKDPTYLNIGDHTETIQIDYDPSKISYKKLLDTFWTSHNPARPVLKRQYMSAIFFHNAEQKQLALETRDREAARIKGAIVTEIVPFAEFYLAEAYHQKYYLQRVPELMREFRTIYPVVQDFINSTAAARVNGYVGGYGSSEVLKTEIDSLGLSPTGNKKLLKMVHVLRPA
jgi:peptide-methionine (S)-S-oxide reductase